MKKIKDYKIEHSSDSSKDITLSFLQARNPAAPWLLLRLCLQMTLSLH